MFDSIIIRPNSHQNHPLDCGQMVENLFFYDKTIVHIGNSEIKTLFDLADVDVLEQLLNHPSLEIYSNNSHTGIIYQGDKLSVSTFSIKDLDLEKEFYEESFKYKGDKNRSRKFAKKISRLIKPHKLPRDFSDVLYEQLHDVEFRNSIVLESLKAYLPEHSRKIEDTRYELEFFDKECFKIHTNIDFTKTQHITLDSPILALINACENIHVMAEASSEISAPDFSSKIIRLKTNKAIERGSKARQEIEYFNRFVYDECWALREAINTKRIHVKPILKVLEKADKYKSWLKDLPNDANLMAEYVEKIEEKTILETFPLKAIKFYLFNGADAILNALTPNYGIPLSLALSAFEAFILDSLCDNWKPNQFINNELRPLVKVT